MGTHPPRLLLPPTDARTRSLGQGMKAAGLSPASSRDAPCREDEELGV